MTKIYMPGGHCREECTEPAQHGSNEPQLLAGRGRGVREGEVVLDFGIVFRLGENCWNSGGRLSTEQGRVWT